MPDRPGAPRPRDNQVLNLQGADSAPLIELLSERRRRPSAVGRGTVGRRAAALFVAIYRPFCAIWRKPRVLAFGRMSRPRCSGLPLTAIKGRAERGSDGSPHSKSGCGIPEGVMDDRGGMERCSGEIPPYHGCVQSSGIISGVPSLRLPIRAGNLECTPALQKRSVGWALLPVFCPGNRRWGGVRQSSHLVRSGAEPLFRVGALSDGQECRSYNPGLQRWGLFAAVHYPSERIG